MKKLTIIIILLINFSVLNAQTAKTDSLLAIIEQLPNNTLKVDSLNAFSWILVNKFQYKEVRLLTNKSIILAKQLNYPKGLGYSYKNIASIYFYQGIYDTAHIYFNKSLEEFTKAKYKKGIVSTYSNLGILALQVANYEKALENTFKSLAMNEEVNNRRGIAKQHISLGSIYQEMHKSDEKLILKHYKKALQISRKIGYKQGVIESNIGLIKFYLKKYKKNIKDNSLADSVLVCLEESYKVSNEIKSAHYITYSDKLLGTLYTLTGEYKKAKFFLNKSLEKHIELKHPHGIASLNYLLGEFYLKTNNSNLAIKHIKKALELSINHEFNYIEKKCLKQLQIIYYKKKQINLAYFYLTKFVTISNKIEEYSSAKKITQLKMQYEFNKKEKEVILLKEVLQKEKKMNKAKIIVVTLIILLLLVLVILLMIIIKKEKEKKRKDKLLKKTEKKLVNLFNNIPVGLYIADSSGQVLQANPSLIKILGYDSKEELLKVDIKDILVKPEQQKENLLKIHKTEEINDNVTQLKRKDGSILYVLDSARSRIQENGKLIIEGSLQDITKIKIAEQALKESEAKLQESNITKDKFFSIIAHDLRSPFNAILGFSKILLNNKKIYNEDKQISMIKSINNSANSAFQLLDNLLTWASSQSRVIKYSPETIRLKTLLFETMLTLQETANQKNIKISNSILEKDVIFADKNMLTTILRNLISNAIKFTPKNGEIKINYKQNDNNVTISVIDNGVGINKNKLQKIFDISEKTSTKGTENETGTGLGLVLCKEFTEKNGGKIWVESEEGKGSVFTFTIPNQ